MRFAVRRGLIAANPCALLANDERPHRAPRKEKHVWSDDEIAAPALLPSSRGETYLTG